jgi:hypothetical protein
MVLIKINKSYYKNDIRAIVIVTLGNANYTFIQPGGKMKILAQIKEIAIHMHSIDYALKCRVCSVDGERILVSPLINKVDMFQLNDPVVCIFMYNDGLYLKGADVKAVDSVGMTAELLITDHDIKEERRIFERHPSSLAISARRKFTSKRLHFIARNISQYGMGVISSADLDIGESIDIDLITGKYMFYFVGKVIWKEKIVNSFEYGFQLTDFDVATKSSFEAYLGKLKEEYRNMYMKAR